MKTLTFEGAGWDAAENNGVGNCRIRTRLTNKEGKLIYLEMSGHATGKSSTPSQKKFPFAGHVSHCFENDCNEHSKMRLLESKPFHYTKENILAMVNKELNCDYMELTVINDGSVRVHDTELALC